MNLRLALLVAACSAALIAPAAAQSAGSVRVTFADGRVSVSADNATLLEILREWERVGGSKFVNAEKIPPAARMTLRLEQEPETRAIEVLLRSAAGYAVAPRMAGMTGPSSVGRVVIMPVSRVASYAQAPPPASPGARTAFEPAPTQISVGPPRPDADGPVPQQIPPPMDRPTGQTQTASGQPQRPGGQSSPLQGTQTQTVPGLGVVTSTQPGVVIQAPPQRPADRRPPVSPTQPVRGGRGGGGG